MVKQVNKNMVQNKKTTTPKGICLNDKDYMNSILSSLKEMSKNYTVALTEASNETLFKSLKKDFDNIIKMQREVYEEMFANGWYALEKSETTKIKTKYEMLCTELSDLESEE